jgi:hypothetical protein
LVNKEKILKHLTGGPWYLGEKTDRKEISFILVKRKVGKGKGVLAVCSVKTVCLFWSL